MLAGLIIHVPAISIVLITIVCYRTFYLRNFKLYISHRCYEVFINCVFCLFFLGKWLISCFSGHQLISLLICPKSMKSQMFSRHTKYIPFICKPNQLILLSWQFFFKMVQYTLKILQCSHRKIFKVCLAIFESCAWKG